MKLKKLLALVLALAMVLSGSVVAFAEGEDEGADYSQADLTALAGIFSKFWDQLPKAFTNGKSPEDLTTSSESGDAWWKDLSYEYEDDDVYYYIGVSWEDAGEGVNRLIGLSFDSLDLKGSLDVSALDELVMLDCGYNQLTSLKVSDSLEMLYCYNNQLKTLDVSKCTGLIVLSCGFNQLTSLDVSNCTGLRTLSCYNNQLTSLDLSKCRELITLNAPSNQLTSLDVSGCSKLTYLDCRNNNLPSKDAVKLAPSLNVVWDQGTYDEYGIIRAGFLFTPQGDISALAHPAPEEPTRDTTTESNRQAEEAAMEVVEAAMEAIREGKTPAKVQNATTAAGASIPAVTVKLYGLTASLSVDSMETMADASVGLKVNLDNGAAELLIPGGFPLVIDPLRVYYPVGYQKAPYGTDIMLSLVKGADARTETYRLGGGTLPTTATATLKTKLTGPVNIYHWNEETRKITLLAAATAENGKVTFATRQLGDLIVTTGTI